MKCPNCGAELREVKSHSGLVIPLQYLLTSISLETVEKYHRGIWYAYLPPREKYEACLLVGSVEISKLDNTTYFNPFKFYIKPEYLQKVREHTLNTIAMEALFKSYLISHKGLDRSIEPLAILNELLRELYASSGIRDKLRNKLESFWEKLRRENV